MKSFYNAATKPRIVLMALRVPLVVGSILNLINQRDCLTKGAAVNYFSLCLNYVVPFSVSLLSTYLTLSVCS